MNLFERVKAILLSPKSEWLVIEREPPDTVGLFKNYVAILAAIPAVASTRRRRSAESRALFSGTPASAPTVSIMA